MTAKEKAKELVGKYTTVLSLPLSKEFALIAVNEIIKYSPNKPVDKIDPIGYFKEVKQEIKKL